MSEECIDAETKVIQDKIFERIAKNDILGFEQLVMALGSNNVDFVDSSGMTPLQNACCKGNVEAVKLLLDLGANVNFSKQEKNYSALHCGAISGKAEICRLLLDAGAIPNALNSINRTPAQMAAFVANHECVDTINNYISFSEIQEYGRPVESNNKSLIPQELLRNFHSFIIGTNLHPVRIALNVQDLGLLKCMVQCRDALENIRDKEMKKSGGRNEEMALKYHYLHWIMRDLISCEAKCKEQMKELSSNDAEPQKINFIEAFVKKVLKEYRSDQVDYLKYTCITAARSFPFRDSNIYQVILKAFTNSDMPPLGTLRMIINGRRPFMDESNYCDTCGKEKPSKKCSKCKSVKYCNRECQRLHWFVHKRSCDRPTSTNNTAISSEEKADSIDANDVCEKVSTLKEEKSNK